MKDKNAALQKAEQLISDIENCPSVSEFDQKKEKYLLFSEQVENAKDLFTLNRVLDKNLNSNGLYPSPYLLNKLLIKLCSFSLVDLAERLYHLVVLEQSNNEFTYGTMIHAKKNNFPAAEKIFNQALERNKANLVVYICFIEAAGIAGKFDRAREVFEKACSNKDCFKDDLLHMYINVLVRGKKFEEARQIFEDYMIMIPKKITNTKKTYYDFHGFTYGSTLVAMEFLLDSSKKGECLRVITGLGRNKNPQVRNALMDYLDKNKIPFIFNSKNKGVIIIRPQFSISHRNAFFKNNPSLNTEERDLQKAKQLITGIKGIPFPSSDELDQRSAEYWNFSRQIKNAIDLRSLNQIVEENIYAKGLFPVDCLMDKLIKKLQSFSLTDLAELLSENDSLESLEFK